MATDGRRLWEAQTSDATIWPLVVEVAGRLAAGAGGSGRQPPGQRPRRPSIKTRSKGNWWRFWTRRTARWCWRRRPARFSMRAEMWPFRPPDGAWPCLTGGAIQVFELPAPPPLPEPASSLPRSPAGPLSGMTPRPARKPCKLKCGRVFLSTDRCTLRGCRGFRCRQQAPFQRRCIRVLRRARSLCCLRRHGRRRGRRDRQLHGGGRSAAPAQ